MPAPTARQLALDELGTPLIETTFVVLDLETTGLRAEADRITEVGAVKVRGGEVLGELRTFVHPGRPIPPAVTAITGITDAMVAGAPTMAGVLDHLLGFLTGAVLVAHNAAFDLAFLRTAASRHGYPPPEPRVVDTARLSRRLLGDEVRDHRLATLARHLHARTVPEHRALADARATVDVLHGLLERAGSLGATTLEDLVELTRSRSHREFRRRSLIADAPRSCGVYRFLDGHGATLYVGKATDLRARLRTYFGQDPRRRIAAMLRETHQVTWQRTPTLLEAEVLELRAIHAEQPRFNRRSRTPRRPRWLVCTREPFPRLSIVQRVGNDHLHPLGPFDGPRTAEAVREAIQEVLPIRSCTFRIRRAQDHPACVLKDLGRCGAPCDGSQLADDYAAVVARVAALAEDPTPLVTGLRRRMAEQAARGRFERAAELRDLTWRIARALDAARDHAWLTAADDLVLRRAVDDHVELVRLRAGALVATERHALDADPASAPADHTVAQPPACRTVGPTSPPSTSPPSTSPPSWEEVELVRTWTTDPEVRLVATSVALHRPIAAGNALATAIAEGRRTDRRVRQDHQLLSGAKVRRRTDASADGRAVG
ncbi:MAG: DEDD exonuclease domain-containing protein [Nitriliruptoraceae bacterium]